MYLHVRDALCDLIPFVQFEKRENTHEGMLLLVKWQAHVFEILQVIPNYVVHVTYKK